MEYIQPMIKFEMAEKNFILPIVTGLKLQAIPFILVEPELYCYAALTPALMALVLHLMYK
jgi:hypothetical protein